MRVAFGNCKLLYHRSLTICKALCLEMHFLTFIIVLSQWVRIQWVLNLEIRFSEMGKSSKWYTFTVPVQGVFSRETVKINRKSLCLTLLSFFPGHQSAKGTKVFFFLHSNYLFTFLGKLQTISIDITYTYLELVFFIALFCMFKWKWGSFLGLWVVRKI